MPMTRQRARSSFTLEIKRSNRRTTEIATPGTTASVVSSSLADQVFGAFSAKPATRQSSDAEPRAPETTPALAGENRSGPAPVAPHVPRVLPDLLSIPLDPVQERVVREAEEQAARRAAARNTRARPADRHPAVAREPAPKPAHIAPAAASATTGTPEPASVKPSSTKPVRVKPASATSNKTAPAEYAGVSGTDKLKPLKRAAMRAERLGLPLPRLPAGQRWKRRLPKACW